MEVGKGKPPRFQAFPSLANPVVKKGVFRSSRKRMNLMPEKSANMLVSSVYLLTTPYSQDREAQVFGEFGVLGKVNNRATASRSKAIAAAYSAIGRSKSRLNSSARCCPPGNSRLHQSNESVIWITLSMR